MSHWMVSEEKSEVEQGPDVDAAHRWTVRSLVRAVQLVDPPGAQHLRRIAHYTRALAQQLHLPSSRVELIAAAAPLHDVGKLGIPPAILAKTDALDPDEWTLMQTHCDLGSELLDGSTSPLLREAQRIALAHHERWDGSGYPNGISEEEIPLGARIVAVADVYDALRSDQSYRSGVSHAKAVGLLLEGDARIRPEQFDPRVLEAFAREHMQLDEIQRTLADTSPR